MWKFLKLKVWNNYYYGHKIPNMATYFLLRFYIRLAVLCHWTSKLWGENMSKKFRSKLYGWMRIDHRIWHLTMLLFPSTSGLTHAKLNIWHCTRKTHLKIKERMFFVSYFIATYNASLIYNLLILHQQSSSLLPGFLEQIYFKASFIIRYVRWT